MVLQKRLDYGFIGYQVPAMPRGRRSSMGRCSRKRKVEEIDMGAFELLATVAGKLLEEIETSPDFSNASSEKVQSVFGKDKVKEEQKDEEKSLKVEPCDQGSSHESGVHSHNQKKGNSEELEAKPHLLVSSDTNIEVPSVGEHLTSDLFPECQDVKLVSRDDDEKSSGCTRSNVTPVKASRLPTYVEDQKIIKMASKYWQVAPKLEGELSYSDEDIKPISRSKKISYKRQRSLRDSFKRRKVEKSSVSTSDEGDCSEGIFSTPKKGISESSIGSGSSVHAGSGVSTSSAVGLESSSQSRGSHVKLSIKSFKVPELFIDISETATVGSLKRTVMEAVAAILGEGLHVGILYEGEKIEDDSKTLLQTGICDDDKLGCLGFALEPNQANSPASLCLKDPSFCPSDVPQPLARYIPSPTLDVEFSAGPDDPPLINLANGVESDQDSVPSPSDMSSIGKVAPESRALVAVPAASTEALAAAMNRKSRRAELAQRRIRRPFSVSEVEALVHAVEKLGTGRWRDVKLRAFDNAKHRTYVDLKDKWKTLVHTARISPQQRRGEPVPQELLDRVLSTHGYWSQHQAKQQVKQLTETCLLLNT